MMTRRQLLTSLAAAQAAPSRSVANSVLVHEHIMVDFIAADQIKPARYDAGEVFRAAKPKLDELKRHGCRRMLECTPNFLGRDPRLITRLSEASGIDIWTNYGPVGCGESEELAELMVLCSFHSQVRKRKEVERYSDGPVPDAIYLRRSM